MRLLDTRPCLPWRFHAAAALVAALLWAAAGPAGAACLATALHLPPVPRALAMAAAAQREHRAFGGQTLDAEGRLTDAGYSEAEDARGGLSAMAPWERVLGYWRAVDPQDARLPSQVRFGALRPASRELLIQALNRATAAHLQGLGVDAAQGLESQDLRAVQAALDRVAGAPGRPRPRRVRLFGSACRLCRCRMASPRRRGAGPGQPFRAARLRSRAHAAPRRRPGLPRTQRRREPLHLRGDRPHPR
jgi:hypothetical protein